MLWLMAANICFMAEYYSIVCVYGCMHVYHSFILHLSISGHLHYFYILAIVNNAAVNIGVGACIF